MRFSDLKGIFGNTFRIGLAGLLVKVTGGAIRIRNAADSADAPLTASELRASGDTIQLNEDAAGSGADWKYNLKRPAVGQEADLNFVFPPNHGTAAYALFTDGNGNTYWGAAAAATNLEATDTTDLAFGDASPKAMFQLPANAVVKKVEVIVDVAFNGAPQLTVGITGTPAKYMAATQNALTEVAGTVFEVVPGLEAAVAAEDLILTYTPGGATAGEARVLVSYVIPS